MFVVIEITDKNFRHIKKCGAFHLYKLSFTNSIKNKMHNTLTWAVFAVVSVEVK